MSFQFGAFFDGRKIALGYEPSRCKVLLRHGRVQIVDAQAVIDRHSAHRPRVLRKEAKVRLDVVALLDGRGEQRDTAGHAVEEVVVHVAVHRRVVERRAVPADPHHETNFVAMRAGHIRRGGAQRDRVVEIVAIDRRCTVNLTGRILGDRNHVEANSWVDLPALVPILLVGHEPRVEQEPVVHRNAPDGRPDGVRIERRVSSGFRGDVRRSTPTRGNAAILLVAEVELVARRRLPRHARRVVTVNLRVRPLAALVGDKDPGERVRVEIVVRDVLLDFVVAVRDVEPQLVFHQRPAAVGVEVPCVPQAVDRSQTLVDVFLREIVVCQALVRVERGDVPVEGVTSLLRNGVHPDA